MTLHRYILSQILWPVLLTFLSLNLLFLMVQLLKVGEVTFGAGLSLEDLLRISVLFLPGFAVFTIPISVLTGVLLGFGRMAADGEMLALSGAGVSCSRRMMMPMLLGIITGLVAGMVAGWLAPASADALQNTFSDLTRRHVVASLEPGRFFEDIPHLVLYPQRPGQTKDSWDGFLLADYRSNKKPYLLLARRASITPRSDRNTLNLALEDGEIHGEEHASENYSVAHFDSGTVFLDIDVLVSSRTRFFSETDRMSLAELDEGLKNPALNPRKRNILIAAWHRRFAFPLSSVFFAMLGTAITATGKLRGWRGTLVASVAMIAGYYLLMRFGDALVEAGWLAPAVAAWLPDALVAAVAIARLLRVERKAG